MIAKKTMNKQIQAGKKIRRCIIVKVMMKTTMTVKMKWIKMLLIMTKLR